MSKYDGYLFPETSCKSYQRGYKEGWEAAKRDCERICPRTRLGLPKATEDDWWYKGYDAAKAHRQ